MGAPTTAGVLQHARLGEVTVAALPAILDWQRLQQWRAETEPFPHAVVTRAIPAQHLDAVRRHYPRVTQAGSLPLSSVGAAGAPFQHLVRELQSARFAAWIEGQLGVEVQGWPTVITVRGQCRARDGKIHRDSTSKRATVLLYLNDDHWQSDTGQLRLLRDRHSLAHHFAEIPPTGGTMVIFRCDANAWHGHSSYEGPRRVLQLNWVSSTRRRAWDHFRHALSARIKRKGTT